MSDQTYTPETLRASMREHAADGAWWLDSWLDPYIEAWEKQLEAAKAREEAAIRFAVAGYTTEVNERECCRYCFAEHEEHREPAYNPDRPDVPFTWVDVTRHEPTCEYAAWLARSRETAMKATYHDGYRAGVMAERARIADGINALRGASEPPAPRYHICGDPNDACDSACMERAASEPPGEEGT